MAVVDDLVSCWFHLLELGFQYCWGKVMILENITFVGGPWDGQTRKIDESRREIRVPVVEGQPINWVGSDPPPERRTYEIAVYKRMWNHDSFVMEYVGNEGSL